MALDQSFAPHLLCPDPSSRILPSFPPVDSTTTPSTPSPRTEASACCPEVRLQDTAVDDAHTSRKRKEHSGREGSVLVTSEGRAACVERAEQQARRGAVRARECSIQGGAGQGSTDMSKGPAVRLFVTDILRVLSRLITSEQRRLVNHHATELRKRGKRDQRSMQTFVRVSLRSRPPPLPCCLCSLRCALRRG
eukprot:TRINITY_DN441_c0_g1_i6.p1 TRINITY_DN441_c0_g1~~TRINITY_DN441_c0_g1_i6.p1  ORF type:complete len:193 (+),score=19.12 TRINITY_DN441_c0_g1_i6:93-671(+)